MKKIEAIIRPEKVTIVKQRLQQQGIGGMTILEATGWSREREFHLQWRGQEIAYDLIPRVKVELVIPDAKLGSVVDAITQSAKTEGGDQGDGVIFISTVESAVNIATSVKGEEVIT